MVTDQQYRDLLEHIKRLEIRIDDLSQALMEVKMMNDTVKMKPFEEQEKHKDTTRYRFNGKVLVKRDLVLEVVKSYVANNDINTIDELIEVFPDYIQGPLGVVKKATEAEKYAGANNRYYFDDDDVLSIGGEYYVICKEWTAKNISRFLEVAETINYKIVPDTRGK